MTFLEQLAGFVFLVPFLLAVIACFAEGMIMKEKDTACAQAGRAKPTEQTKEE